MQPPLRDKIRHLRYHPFEELAYSEEAGADEDGVVGFAKVAYGVGAFGCESKMLQQSAEGFGFGCLSTNSLELRILTHMIPPLVCLNTPSSRRNSLGCTARMYGNSAIDSIPLMP